MREVSREEFQKRMVKQGWFRHPELFVDLQKAGLVVFDQKELSLSAPSKERSLRKLFDKRPRFAFNKEKWIDSAGEPINDEAVEYWLSDFERAFDETFSSEKRFLGDLQKALANRPSHKWMIRNLDKIEDVEISFLKIEKLFSAFQGTFFAKEASPRKPECDNTSCEFELNGECTHPNPQIKPRDCLSWEKKIEPSSRTK